MRQILHSLNCPRSFLLIATSLLACGCAGVTEEALKHAKQVSTDFRLGPEDVLEVVVWRNQDLTRDVLVRPDGMISLPLVGDVRAAGLTADELAKRIEEGLKEFMETPTVSVHVKQVNSYAVYVLGEVQAPGRYQLKSYTTILQAIALAGGFTQYASRNSMQVIRHGSNGAGMPKEIRIPVSYDDLLSGDGEIGNLVLMSGDTVVVP